MTGQQYRHSAELLTPSQEVIFPGQHRSPAHSSFLSCVYSPPLGHRLHYLPAPSSTSFQIFLIMFLTGKMVLMRHSQYLSIYFGIYTLYLCVHAHTHTHTHTHIGLTWWLIGKESAYQFRRLESDPLAGKILLRRNGNPLQYSCLGNPRGAWDPWGPWISKESDTT